MSRPLILLVEDEPALRRYLAPTLDRQGYGVLEASKGAEAISLARSHNPDLVLLDLGLPDQDGLEVLKDIRSWSQMPIMVLSAREQERQKVHALDNGADDYLTKPFGLMELLARIRLAFRHRVQREAPSLTVRTGELVVDLELRRVLLKGREVRLTPLAYKLLAALARQAGRVLTHHQLLSEVWGPAQAGQTHYLRIYMGQLRHRLEEDPARPRYLITEPGVGYRLDLV